MKRHLLITLLAAIVFSIATPARADQVQIGRHIVVNEGENAGDIVCVGCSVEVHGTAGDVVAVGGGIDISGRVTGDVVAVGGAVSLGPGASVKGDVVTVGGRLQRDPTAVISGEVSETAPGMGLGGIGLIGIALLFILPALIFGFVLALVVYAILGEPRTQAIADTISFRTGAVFGAGLAACLVFVAACAIFARIRHGGGLITFIVVTLFGILAIVGYTGVSYWVGRKISPAAGGFVKVLVGALVVTLLQLVPVVNIVAVVFALMALGSAVLSGFGTQPALIAAPPPAAPPPPMAAAK